MERCPVHQKAEGSIPGEGTYLSCGLIGSLGNTQEAMDVSLSPPLKSINMPLGEDVKNKTKCV